MALVAGSLNRRLWSREIWVLWDSPAKNRGIWAYSFTWWLQIPRSSTPPLALRWIKWSKRQVDSTVFGVWVELFALFSLTKLFHCAEEFHNDGQSCSRFSPQGGRETSFKYGTEMFHLMKLLWWRTVHAFSKHKATLAFIWSSLQIISTIWCWAGGVIRSAENPWAKND